MLAEAARQGKMAFSYIIATCEPRMTTILQRVCWNTDSWKKPSGETIDSGNPGKRGYGSEEWNFCTADELDGSVFGWL